MKQIDIENKGFLKDMKNTILIKVEYKRIRFKNKRNKWKLMKIILSNMTGHYQSE